MAGACLSPESWLIDWVAIYEVLWTRDVERIVKEGFVLLARSWKLNFGLLWTGKIQDEDAPETSSCEKGSDGQLVLKHARTNDAQETDTLCSENIRVTSDSESVGKMTGPRNRLRKLTGSKCVYGERNVLLTSMALW